MKKVNRYFIRDALEAAIEALKRDDAVEDAPRLDHDTINCEYSPRRARVVERTGVVTSAACSPYRYSSASLPPVIVVLGRLSGLDRDRAMYPIALIVIAAYYVLFATMGGAQSLPAELIAATIFSVIAIIGFRTSLWWVAAGIAGHGMFDWVVHPHLIANPGMPLFWPAFCGSIDLALGVLIAILLLRRAIPARG